MRMRLVLLGRVGQKRHVADLQRRDQALIRPCMNFVVKLLALCVFVQGSRCMDMGETLGIDRMQFGGDIGQVLTVKVAPGVEEITTRAKAQLGDDEFIVLGEAIGEAIAGQKNMLTLRQGMIALVVDVSVVLRIQAAFLPTQSGG